MIATILATLAVCVTPAEATRAALADVQALAPQYRQQMRYVVCENQEQEIAVRYVLNAVCRSRRIVKPERVGSLLRIDLAALADQKDPRTYHAIHAAWERLSFDDQYYHVKTSVVVSGQSGIKTVSVDGGWVNLQSAASLRVQTGSAGAVLRADYFVSRVAADDYYAWAGVPEKQGDFLNGLGVDKSVIERLAADTAANLFKSRITFKSRRIVDLPSPQGRLFVTLDVEDESPDRSAIRNPVDVSGPQGDQRYKFQASEIFFTRANGMWGFALFGADGKRQEVVPQKIATDHMAQDGIVRPGISCVRCHGQNVGALQPFTDTQYPLLTGEAAILKSYSPEVAQRVGELYQPRRLSKSVQRAAEDYEEAVHSACGVDGKKAASALSHVYANYVEHAVDRKKAAAESNVSEDEFTARTVASTDPIVLALRAGIEVSRKDWEASWQDVQLRLAK